MRKLLREPEERASAFKRIRDAHESELAEDYVELIEDLIEATGEARPTDIAKYFGIGRSTATIAIQRLQKQGLVRTAPYRSISLTPKGTALAAKARRRHEILYDFLIAIGLSEDIAFSDSEGMEHHISEETLAALGKLTKKLKP
ncbi:MAG: manganese-binding transcriptional regulator MntR [Pseudomonadota bacterium]